VKLRGVESEKRLMTSTGNLSPRVSGLAGRQVADVLLFGVTAIELTILVWLTPSFSLTDWIYVLQHAIVLAIALTRPSPDVRDSSPATMLAIAVAYAYPYAQIIYLRTVPGVPASPELGLVLVIISACLSFASLITLGRLFGVRPALRGVMTKGPYAVVRHPMYLAYVIGDIGYNLQEWNTGTALLVLAGWASLLYRINAEERVLSQDPRWRTYSESTRYRLIPGFW
jgi:protein-S-isoprenylcysteine O-methyltransferase Ste14